MKGGDFLYFPNISVCPVVFPGFQNKGINNWQDRCDTERLSFPVDPFPCFFPSYPLARPTAAFRLEKQFWL